MSGRAAFVDTNIFVYLQTLDDAEKHRLAKDVIDRNDVVISTQVLNELASVLTKKLKVAPQATSGVVEALASICDVRSVTAETIFGALKLMQEVNASYYDALIIQSALESGCDVLFTEDLQTGQVVGGKLTIRNPFAAD